jgi:hypothetical protein
MAFIGVFIKPCLRWCVSYAATESQPKLLEVPPTRPPPTGAINRDVSRPGRPATMLTEVELPVGPEVVVD